ncbi:MAG: hypothetical protein RLZZ455_1146 [Candidatus Parcubacteria bacterium]|jgi:hypothetical protein
MADEGSFFMEKQSGTVVKNVRRTVLFITLSAIACVLIVNIGLGIFLSQGKKSDSNERKSAVVFEEKKSDLFLYEGKEGKNALQLLRQHAKSIVQGGSGIVTGINGRIADESKKEFWAFYVNGKMAEVGPAAYVTQDGDKIMWKIEKY